ncbi:NADH-ubiquinone oxidoreductase-F iron-sulfur binding region domain-containing protein [Clostridium estertheticum]|uniref:SLBB domain-containing protein n=1 Tax=Clostridium estertheticum TaxID=238834 RepID=A0AA47I6C1_9CLOT|nr:NADH-ubiquinone oxidoreductase-F iron-sulfur binding region domain-containing protein [Clostridium estertheticum]MBU3156543.1 SLBB domain-containing protein [Clostridium estertheticum]WAG59304.1 SLBB domain-containing protein [Clostridium estertheticum]
MNTKYKVTLSGDVVNKECFEVPTNTLLRDIIFGLGGGVVNGRKLKAVQVGGSSCSFLTPDQLNTPVDLESMRAIGGALGSAAVLVIDDRHNMVDILVGITHFFKHKSCGKCVACREGTLRVAQLTEKIADAKGTEKDMQQIRDLSEYMGKTCFCPLGQGATTAIISAMNLFPDDFSVSLSTQEV